MTKKTKGTKTKRALPPSHEDLPRTQTSIARKRNNKAEPCEQKASPRNVDDKNNRNSVKQRKKKRRKDASPQSTRLRRWDARIADAFRASQREKKKENNEPAGKQASKQGQVGRRQARHGTPRAFVWASRATRKGKDTRNDSRSLVRRRRRRRRRGRPAISGPREVGRSVGSVPHIRQRHAGERTWFLSLRKKKIKGEGEVVLNTNASARVGRKRARFKAFQCERAARLLDRRPFLRLGWILLLGLTGEETFTRLRRS